MKKSNIILAVLLFGIMLLSYGIETAQYQLVTLQNTRSAIFLLCVICISYFIILPFLNNLYTFLSKEVSFYRSTMIQENIIRHISETANNHFYNPDFLKEIHLCKNLTGLYSEYTVSIYKLLKYFFNYLIYIVAISTVSTPVIIPFVFFTLIYIIVKFLYAAQSIDTLIDNVSDDKDAEYYRKILSDYNYVRDIRLFQFDEYICQKSIQAFHRGLEKRYRLRNKNAIICPLLNVLFAGCIIGIGAISVLNQNISFASVVLVASCTIKSLMQVEPASDAFGEFIEKRGAKQKINGIISRNRTQYNRSGIFIEEIQNIRFENVSFSYDGTKDIIHDMNFEWKSGENICILGINGAGKSTLLNLILGINKPTSGTVFVNNIPLENIDYSSYVSCIAACSQDFAHFKDSIENNVIFGSNEKLDLIDYKYLSVTKGSMIGPDLYADGVELSGGQWQKTAVCRSNLNCRKKHLIIMDEPTAAMDAYSESSFFEKIMELKETCNAIFITHRVGYAKMADKIYIVDRGKIVESGSPADLMDNGFYYKNMYIKQGEMYEA